MSHEVVYIHDCTAPKRGPLTWSQWGYDTSSFTSQRLHIIAYDSKEHEARNLLNPDLKEHICSWCDKPMTRLGAAAEIRAAGPTKETTQWLQPLFFESGEGAPV